MSNKYVVSECVRCLQGVDYEVVKHQTYFEWVIEYENKIKELGVEVFETVGVNSEKELKIAADRLDECQDTMNNKMDEMVEQLSKKPFGNEAARKFAAEWTESFKYQATSKYHYVDGLTAKKIRWGFEVTIKYVIICATHLANKDDNEEFKKFVSEYSKDSVIQCIIDSLRQLKDDLELQK